VKIALIAGLAALVAAAAASAAPNPIPGIRTPSGNISCLYVPRSGALGLPDLFCNIRRSTYGARVQRVCVGGKAGVDWHGFELTPTKKATVVCSGGTLYDPYARSRPTRRSPTGKRGATARTRASRASPGSRARTASGTGSFSRARVMGCSR
jgi:hypothetical protein